MVSYILLKLYSRLYQEIKTKIKYKINAWYEIMGIQKKNGESSTREKNTFLSAIKIKIFKYKINVRYEILGIPKKTGESFTGKNIYFYQL